MNTPPVVCVIVWPEVVEGFLFHDGRGDWRVVDRLGRDVFRVTGPDRSRPIGIYDRRDQAEPVLLESLIAYRETLDARYAERLAEERDRIDLAIGRLTAAR